MLTIGLVGGVASGKSLVADLLAEKGAVVLSADKTAHEVLRLPEVVTELVDRWGSDILDAEGNVKRSAIANKVFGPGKTTAEERAFLEAVVHPRTRQALEQQRGELAATGSEVFVIDAPLLIEAGWDSACDHVVFVDTPAERRREFAAARGWDAEEIHRREDAQMPIEEKQRHADHVVSNTGSKSDLRQHVEVLWNTLVLP